MWYYLDLVSCSFIQRTIQQLLRVTQFWKVIIRIIQITLMGKLEWHSIMLGLLSWPSLFPDYLFLCQVRFWKCFFVSFSFYYQFLQVWSIGNSLFSGKRFWEIHFRIVGWEGGHFLCFLQNFKIRLKMRFWKLNFQNYIFVDSFLYFNWIWAFYLNCIIAL